MWCLMWATVVVSSGFLNCSYNSARRVNISCAIEIACAGASSSDQQRTCRYNEPVDTCPIDVITNYFLCQLHVELVRGCAKCFKFTHKFKFVSPIVISFPQFRLLDVIYFMLILQKIIFSCTIFCTRRGSDVSGYPWLIYGYCSRKFRSGKCKSKFCCFPNLQVF